jgi:hypothetical protein
LLRSCKIGLRAKQSLTFKNKTMKRIKVSIFAVIALIMGIAASAFTAPKAPLSDGWFTINPGADPTKAASYTYSGATSPCSGNDVLCAIIGTKDPLHQTQPMQSDVNSAASASNNFQQPVSGQVDFKNQ